MTRSNQTKATRMSEGVSYSVSRAVPESADDSSREGTLALACPTCHYPLIKPDDSVAACRGCGQVFPSRDGIWRFLLPEWEQRHLERIRAYRQVRSAEDWGSEDPAYYRSLPDVAPGDRWAEVWKVRRRSYQFLIERVISSLERSTRRPLIILDLGAGNGWLSHRLANRGHVVAAVDLSVDERDGLGAIDRYRGCSQPNPSGALIPIQADFDHLPFESGRADAVVFNASFHHSLGYETTIREARRILRPGGTMAIIDTPFYSTAAAGVAMLRERDDGFKQTYGIRASTLPPEGFLDEDRWHALRVTTGMVWQKPGGIGSIRRMGVRSTSKVKGKRETATFPVFVGKRLADGAQAQPGRTTGAKIKAALGRARLRLEFRLRYRRRVDRVVSESVAGRRLAVYPTVFNPVLFRSGRFFGETLSSSQVPPGSDVLDLGTGCGVGAIIASEWAQRVVAVDVNPEAVRCARFNADQLRLGEKIEVREGNLFEPVSGETFDAVLFNPPYYRGAPRDAFDQAWRSDDVVDRFTAQLGEHLRPGGWALVLLSTDGEGAEFVRTFVRSGWLAQLVAIRHYASESFSLYRLGRASEGDDDRSL